MIEKDEADRGARDTREGRLVDAGSANERPLLRAEGSLVDVSELKENPFARSSSWRSAFRGSGTRALGAAALAIAVLTLGWHLRPVETPEEAFRGSPDGVVHLQAADPRALKNQLVEELRAVGVQASGYEQLGVTGIDASLPQPVSQDLRGVLERHGMPVPKDGVLRVEIAAPQRQ